MLLMLRSICKPWFESVMLFVMKRMLHAAGCCMPFCGCAPPIMCCIICCIICICICICICIGTSALEPPCMPPPITFVRLLDLAGMDADTSECVALLGKSSWSWRIFSSSILEGTGSFPAQLSESLRLGSCNSRCDIFGLHYLIYIYIPQTKD